MDVKELVGTNNHYSCSNQRKIRKTSEIRTRQPRNFYFMTLDELVEYWKEMDEKINKAEKYKYKRENKEIDETQLEDEFF